MAALQRSQQHRMLAGVIGGVADYYGWNPTLLCGGAWYFDLSDFVDLDAQVQQA